MCRSFFIYLFVFIFIGFVFILLDYETDDEAKGLLDDSEENGKNNWTTIQIRHNRQITAKS